MTIVDERKKTMRGRMINRLWWIVLVGIVLATIIMGIIVGYYPAASSYVLHIYRMGR